MNNLWAVSAFIAIIKNSKIILANDFNGAIFKSLINKLTGAYLMTYEKYIADAKAAQLNYCAIEQKRIARLEKLFDEYRQAAHAIGFHPLTPAECQMRKDELRVMIARVNETHGDTPASRAWYDANLKSGET
jgi:hypothetical protein